MAPERGSGSRGRSPPPGWDERSLQAEVEREGRRRAKGEVDEDDEALGAGAGRKASVSLQLFKESANRDLSLPPKDAATSLRARDKDAPPSRPLSSHAEQSEGEESEASDHDQATAVPGSRRPALAPASTYRAHAVFSPSRSRSAKSASELRSVSPTQTTSSHPSPALSPGGFPPGPSNQPGGFADSGDLSGPLAPPLVPKPAFSPPGSQVSSEPLSIEGAFKGRRRRGASLSGPEDDWSEERTSISEVRQPPKRDLPVFDTSWPFTQASGTASSANSTHPSDDDDASDFDQAAPPLSPLGYDLEVDVGDLDVPVHPAAPELLLPDQRENISPRASLAFPDDEDEELGRESVSVVPPPTLAVPLRPFDNQVGGHHHFFRFSRKAVCKVRHLCSFPMTPKADPLATAVGQPREHILRGRRA